MKLAKRTPAENENSYKCSSCTVYIVMIVVFTIDIGTVIYFLYSYWYLTKDAPDVDFNTRTQTDIY